MKLTKSQLKQIIKEEIAKAIGVQKTDELTSHDQLQELEKGEGPYYAYVEIPYEGAFFAQADSVENAREEGGNYGEVRAIFTANIIEGEL